MRQKFGTAMFWVGWPAWFVYFKLFPRRSRVLVICENKILFNKTIMGDGRWGLPGGGARINESMIDSAVRELAEEVGINVSPDNLKSLGDYEYFQRGLKAHSYFFLLNLDKQPELKLQKHEISDAIWIDKAELKTADLNDGARYAIKTYLDDTLL